jgi:hypothetical protein
MLVSALDLTLPEPPGASGNRIVAYRAMTVVLLGDHLSPAVSLSKKKTKRLAGMGAAALYIRGPGNATSHQLLHVPKPYASLGPDCPARLATSKP